MKFYGGEPNVAGSMDKINPIEHGRLITDVPPTAKRPEPEPLLEEVEEVKKPRKQRDGHKVTCLKTGGNYPSIKAAAMAADVHYTTMYHWVRAGRGWVKVDG